MWLPPFRQRLEERKRTVAALRAEVSRLEPALREGDELQDTRARLQVRQEIVNRLWEVSARPRDG